MSEKSAESHLQLRVPARMVGLCGAGSKVPLALAGDRLSAGLQEENATVNILANLGSVQAMPARQCIPIFSKYSNNFAMTIIFQYILFVFRLSVRYIPICAESLKRNFIHTADGFFTECPSF